MAGELASPAASPGGARGSSRRVAALRLLRRRLIQAVPLMLGVVVINFVLIQLAPGSFLELMTAENQVSDPASGANGYPIGVERGCYTVAGSTFTTSVAVGCRPNALPALDQNGIGGFSGRNGAAIPFVITSQTTITIGGVLYDRIVPAG